MKLLTAQILLEWEILLKWGGCTHHAIVLYSVWLGVLGEGRGKGKTVALMITVNKKNTFLLFIKKLKPKFNQFNPAAAAAVVVTVAAVAATKNHKLLFCSWGSDLEIPEILYLALKLK